MNIETNAASTDIFISASILSGEIYDETRGDNKGDWKRQYEIWSHAERILAAPSPTDNDLSCALFQLNRAVDFRDKILDATYAFKKIPNRISDNKHEVMESLGIIKTILKRKLDAIRNHLTHLESVPPPPLAVCRELSEFTWYYLKTTDRLAQQAIDSLVISAWSNPKCLSKLTVMFKPGEWKLSVIGSIDVGLLLSHATAECISVKLKRSATKERDGSLNFSGQITGTTEVVDRLVRLFFEESSL